MNLHDYFKLKENSKKGIVVNNSLIGSKVAWEIGNIINVSPAMYTLLDDYDVTDQELYLVAKSIEIEKPPLIAYLQFLSNQQPTILTKITGEKSNVTR